MNSINQVIKLIERSQNILILLPKDAQGENFDSGLALFFTLKKLEKNAKLFLEKMSEKFQPLISELSDGEILTKEKLETNDKEVFPKNFLISIDGQNKKISEMRYEKSDQDLKIYLTLENGQLEEKDISFASLPVAWPEVDLIITLGVKSLEDLAKIFNQWPGFFYGVPILNLDNQILSKTIAYLTEGGTNQPETKTTPEIKLLARILERSNFNEERKLHFATLSKKDFQETKTTPKDLAGALGILKSNFWPSRSWLVLWESHNSPNLIKGAFWSNQENLILKILENFEGTSRGKGVLFLARENNINLVKERVFNCLS